MKLILSNSAQKELDKIPDPIALKISHKIFDIAANPYGLGSRKLEGGKGYRIRIGDYRVIYTINKDEKSVTIIRVKHRKEVYR